MKTIKQVVTGAETIHDSTHAVAALINFYRAFNNQDLELMQANWLQSDAASMSNPLGGIKRGWNEIKGVYENIFFGPASVYVEFYDYSMHESDACFFVAGRERGFIDINARKIELAIRTTRIYTFEDGQWRQVHHHGSMDDVELLSRYQSAIFNQKK